MKITQPDPEEAWIRLAKLAASDRGEIGANEGPATAAFTAAVLLKLQRERMRDSDLLHWTWRAAIAASVAAISAGLWSWHAANSEYSRFPVEPVQVVSIDPGG